MQRLISLTIILCGLFTIVLGGNYNYYWRNYDGKIPRDAVSAGFEISKATHAYIGQGLVFTQQSAALIPFILTKDQTNVTTYYQGNQTISTEIKILCSHASKAVHWVATNSSTYLVDMLDKDPVIGGLELNNNGNKNITFHIGRGEVNGKWVLGRINHMNHDYVTLQYPQANSEGSLPSFLALVAY